MLGPGLWEGQEELQKRKGGGILLSHLWPRGGLQGLSSAHQGQ